MIKMITVCLVIVFLSCCTMSEQQFEDEYNKISNELNERIRLCVKQNEDIIIKPIRKLEKAINQDEYVEFIKDESKALFYIDSFDLSKLTAHQEYRYYDLLIKNCSKKNMNKYAKLEKDRPHCSNVFDEVFFMRGLIFATKNYSWKPETIQKVKNKIFNYIESQNIEENTPLIYRQVSVTLLEDMLKYALVDKKHKSTITNLAKKAKAEQERLVAKIKKDNRKKMNQYSCENLKAFHKRELAVSRQLAQEIKTLLEIVVN